MRSRKTHPRHPLCAVMFCLMLLQLGINGVGRGKGIRHGPDRFVAERELLPSAGAFPVRDKRVFLQPLAKARAVIDQHRAGARHPLVEFRQRVEKSGILLAVAQNARFVLVGTGILRKRGFIARTELAKRPVHKPPSCRRSVSDEEQILRTEKNRAQYGGQVACAFGAYLIDAHFAPLAGRKKNLHKKAAVSRENLPAQRALAASEGDQLAVLSGAGGPAAGKIADRLEKIGLALRVLTDDDIAVRRKGDLLFAVIAEILQRKLIDLHSLPSGLGRCMSQCRPDESFCRAACTSRR